MIDPATATGENGSISSPGTDEGPTSVYKPARSSEATYIESSPITQQSSIAKLSMGATEASFHSVASDVEPSPTHEDREEPAPQRIMSDTQRQLHDILTTECLVSTVPCSGCGCNEAHLREHPLFDVVGTCVRCLDYLDPVYKDTARELINTGWERDNDDKEIYCRLCGEGGEILQCDKCIKALCRLCLSRWLGEEHWEQLTSSDSDWYCPDCEVNTTGISPLLQLIRERQLAALLAYVSKVPVMEASAHRAEMTADPALPLRQHTQWPVWLRNGGSVEVLACRQWREASVIEVFDDTCYCRYQTARGLWSEEIPPQRIRRPGAGNTVNKEGDVLIDGRSVSVCRREEPEPELEKFVLNEDISRGLERLPIPLVVDQIRLGETKGEALTRVWLPTFTYVNHSVAGKSLIGTAIPIRCVGACVGCQGDRCQREPSFKERELREIEWRNRVEVALGTSDCGRTSLCSWGAYTKNGYLKWTLDCIVECNFLCDCNYDTCPLRVVQKGITKRLEVFWTGRDRGWGVRSVEPIKAGAFICEYAGELLPESVAEARGKELSDNYLFDLARHGAGKTWKVGAGGAQPPRKKRSTLAGDREVEASSNGETFQCSSSEDDDSVVSICEDVARNSEFTIDAHYFGNVGRFVNHSCSPNLVIQRVLVDTHDYRLPRLALFAETNIDSLVELTYDYGYRVGLVAGKTMECKCGSANCKRRLY